MYVYVFVYVLMFIQRFQKKTEDLDHFSGSDDRDRGQSLHISNPNVPGDRTRESTYVHPKAYNQPAFVSKVDRMKKTVDDSKYIDLLISF